MCAGVYLSGKVVEAEHKSPVEVPFSSQRVEMDVRLLFVSFKPLYPAAERTEASKHHRSLQRPENNRQTSTPKFTLVSPADVSIHATHIIPSIFIVIFLNNGS